MYTLHESKVKIIKVSSIVHDENDVINIQNKIDEEYHDSFVVATCLSKKGATGDILNDFHIKPIYEVLLAIEEE